MTGEKVIKREVLEDGKLRLIKTFDPCKKFKIQFQARGTRGYRDRAVHLQSEEEARQEFEKHFSQNTPGDLALEEQESVKKYSVPKMTCRLIREGKLEAGNNAVTAPGDIKEMLMEHLRYLDREHFLVVLLNTKNKVVGVSTVSIGSLNATVVHPREVLKPAILAGAASFIVVHNHPSGDPLPSQEDLQVTRRLHDAAGVMGIQLRDHVVIGDDCYTSFREKGLL